MPEWPEWLSRETPLDRDIALCAGCWKEPHELEEYRALAHDESSYGPPLDKRSLPAMARLIVQEEEGTYDRRTGLFLCTDCYIRYGMPTGPRGWKAQPHRLKLLGVPGPWM